MPSVRFVATISVIIGIIVIVGVVFSISSRPGLPAGNNKKPNRTIHQVFLNNSTHIDTPFVKEYSMPNSTWPNAILVARNGLVWTVGTMSHTLIGFDPKQGKIRSSYPIITPEEKANKTNPPVQTGIPDGMVYRRRDRWFNMVPRRGLRSALAL